MLIHCPRNRERYSGCVCLQNETAGMLRDVRVVFTHLDSLVVTTYAIMMGNGKGMKVQPSCDN